MTEVRGQRPEARGQKSELFNHQSSIINHQSSIINHQSSIINHQSNNTSTWSVIKSFFSLFHGDDEYETFSVQFQKLLT
jgi:ABC-type phosphate/phosphonate transport system ATPase subunit